MATYWLIMYVTIGGSSPPMVVVPKPMSLEQCEAVGKTWQSKVREERFGSWPRYLCLSTSGDK